MWSNQVPAVWAGDTSVLLKVQGCHHGSHNPNGGHVAVTRVKLAPSSPSALLSLIFTVTQIRIGPAAHAFIVRPSMQHIKFCSLIPNFTFVLFIKHSLWGITMRILGFDNLSFFSLTLPLLVWTILDNGLMLLSLLWLGIETFRHYALTFFKWSGDFSSACR